MEAARVLAKAAAHSRFHQAPETVQANYNNFLLDTVAVMVAGAAHPSVSAAREAFVRTGGRGPASVVGFSTGTPVATAALVNGAAMTVLQLQDGHRHARGHPMSHVLPAALAVAEEIGADTALFFDAIVAGYEASARIGAALGGMQPLLHDTGTFGTIGAAVATAFLIVEEPEDRADLIAASIENAAAIALFPFRDTCMEGAGVHHLFVGVGAQNGVQAARAAHAGLTPSMNTLERFFGPRAGENFNADALVEAIGPDGLWSSYLIESAYLKWHPVCAHLGPMLDCIELLRERLGGFDISGIASVEIQTYSTALQYDAPRPRSDLAARFSFRTAAALALTSSGLSYRSFLPENFMRADVQEMLSRITLGASPNLDILYPEHRPARVEIVLADGRKERAEVLFPKGDGPNRLSREEVELKARNLLIPVCGPQSTEHLITMLDVGAARPAENMARELGKILRQIRQEEKCVL